MTELGSAQSGTTVHPLLQTARGLIVDEAYISLEVVLARAVEIAKDVEAKRDRYRAALEEIADISDYEAVSVGWLVAMAASALDQQQLDSEAPDGR